jgi:hypothetical protein
VAVQLDDVVDHLRLWQSETYGTIEVVRAYREEVERGSSKLENPAAILDYVDFFLDFFQFGGSELDRILSELPRSITREHVDALRQIASNSAAEQRRCVTFRDKWINKILPYEDMRPLLDAISLITRDQLSDYRDLTLAAARLEVFGGVNSDEPGVGSDRALDRRALFNRLFKR